MTTRTFVLAITVLGGLTFAGSEARARDNRSVDREMQSDPVYLRYFKPRSVGGGCRNTMFYDLKNRCSVHLHRCKWGWKAFQGKPVPGVGAFLKDSMAHALWGPHGQTYNFRLEQFDPQGGARAPVGLVLYRVPGAADIIEKSIDSKRKLDELWVQKYKGHPYRALWYLGAKNKLDTMIKGLAWKSHRGTRKHLVALLTLLDSWKLSKRQIRAVEKVCNDTVFSATGGHDLIKAACIRWLGRIRTKSADARSHLRNFAGGNSNFLKTEALRALGHLGLRSARSTFQRNLGLAYRPKTKRVRRRRKSKRMKIDAWTSQYHAVPSAVALAGMGDRKALAAIRYWLSLEERGGRTRLVWSQGFTELYKEVAFASPKARKKLLPLLKKAFKKAQRASGSNPRIERAAKLAAIGLAQMGTKAGLKATLKVLSGSDLVAVKNVLRAFGGEPKKHYMGARSPVGIGRVLVGNKGLRARDARKILKTIKNRFRFWADSGVKKMAIDAYLNIETRIQIVKKKL